MKFIKHFLIFIIYGLRPLFGFALCKYPVSCTRYAEIVLEQYTLCKALFLILKRVASCNPFTIIIKNKLLHIFSSK